jgi:hypothetical protein
VQIPFDPLGGAVLEQALPDLVLAPRRRDEVEIVGHVDAAEKTEPRWLVSVER